METEPGELYLQYALVFWWLPEHLCFFLSRLYGNSNSQLQLFFKTKAKTNAWWLIFAETDVLSALYGEGDGLVLSVPFNASSLPVAMSGKEMQTTQSS